MVARTRRMSLAVPSTEADANAGSKRAPAAAPICEDKEDGGGDLPTLPQLLKTLARLPQPSVAAPAWSPPSGHQQAHHRAPLLSREEAPQYLTGNPYVLSGFRQCASVGEAVGGLWYLHNATWDTWTSIGSFLHSHV